MEKKQQQHRRTNLNLGQSPTSVPGSLVVTACSWWLTATIGPCMGKEGTQKITIALARWEVRSETSPNLRLLKR